MTNLFPIRDISNSQALISLVSYRGVHVSEEIMYNSCSFYASFIHKALLAKVSSPVRLRLGKKK